MLWKIFRLSPRNRSFYWLLFEKKNYLQLLQLGIFRERDDPYMNEMVDWWLIEGDLREKFFDVLVPRFAHDPGIFMLP